MSEGEQRLHAASLPGSSDDGNNSDFYDPRQSPPKAIVDSSPLQPAMDKNKESLKVKLMVRRPHSQLVEQGIIPPLKTSPAIHEQCKQLERAKTSDLLKAKIQQRPNREDLERRHILEEDECHIDPSLAEKQRMLKKARLADQLNSQIQHRPGPLELIKKNILHTEKPIEKIVKEGLVAFKATSEGLPTRPQHPHKYITFEDDSQSSESDTRQTPPRGIENTEQALVPAAAASIATAAAPTAATDMLQAAAASAGIVTVALTIPTSAGKVVVTSAPLLDNKFPACTTTPALPYVPPPPPLPPAVTPQAIQVKQETANLFEELCQSVAGPTASPGCPNFLPMIASPTSLGSTASTLSPLSSVASPPHSLTPRPTSTHSPALQLHAAAHPKSDAPGKDKNRKKSKSKPISKARTIKFHEYKGPPSAAASAKTSAENNVEETSYQLMLEQQNCLLKFLETLNTNQSIIPATTTATSASTTISSTAAAKAAIAAGSSNPSQTSSPAINFMPAVPNDGPSSTSSPASSTFSVISTPRPPPMPSPALSVSSSIPASPATSYADSTCSLADITRLEKMKVSDLKMQLKRRNLPVSGPKPQLIERLKPFLPLETMDTTSSNSSAKELISATPGPPASAVENMDASGATPVADVPVAMLVSSPRPAEITEAERMDVVQQADSPRSIALQTLLQPQPQTATIILSNEDLLREQQRKIDELQRQLQRSQQELQQIRQRQQQQQLQQQQQQQQSQPQIILNAMPTQQITLIAKTSPATQSVTLVPQIQKTVCSTPVPAKTSPKTNAKTNARTNVKTKAATVALANSSSQTPPANSQAMTQKMVVKQQLEAKIQKQKQAAAAAAAQAQAQLQVPTQSLAHRQAQTQTQAQTQLRLLTQKTQTVLIPTNTITTPNNSAKIAVRQKNAVNNNSAATTTTIVANQLPLTKATNNLGLVWNENNQTIFLVGLNDQQMTAHTIGNISLANVSPATKKLLNGHQRTGSLPSIVFPIPAAQAYEQQLMETKPIISQHQLLQLQTQQQPPQPNFRVQHQQATPIIQLDIKPQNLTPPPPPPPPQYEEATKQLAASKSAKVTNKTHANNVKTKQDPNAMKISQRTTSPGSGSGSGKAKKSLIKSEKLTDVLDILIKQGELPESAALEPMTPIAPLTPGGNNALMTDMSCNLIFTPGVDGAPGRLVPKEEPGSIVKSHNEVLPMEMEFAGSGHQQQRGSHDVFQILSGAHSPPSPAADQGGQTAPDSTSAAGVIESVDMASPPQSDCHIDAESVAKTLDLFLEQHQATSSPSTAAATEQHHTSPLHHRDMLPPTNCTTNSPMHALGQHSAASDGDKLNHFDEFELLELMSQQLEMDIGDDGSNFAASGSSSSPSRHHFHQQHHLQEHPQQQQVHSDNSCQSAGMNGLRRAMNPSLQPSISELIQQQMQQQTNANQQHNSNNSPTHHQSSGGAGDGGSGDNTGIVADIASPTSSNINADFSSVFDRLSQHHQHSLQQQQQQQQDECNSSSSNNNNHLSGDDVDDVVNHFASTPMDVCDDVFDNPLSSFSFSALSPDSNINTPPHPFGSGGVLGMGVAGGSSTCGMAAVQAAAGSSQLLHHNLYHQPLSGEQPPLSTCGSSCGPAAVEAVNGDSFSSNAHFAADNIFDLFNIDDYKMSWGEGDFAV